MMKMRIHNRINEYEKRKKLRNNMTKAEIILWSKLKHSQIRDLKFRRQHSIGPFILDFYCPKLRLAIEVDGPSHFEDGAQEYDEERQKYIESCNISFLRFTNSDIYKNLDGVLLKIQSTIPSLIKEGCPKGGVVRNGKLVN